MTSPLSLELLLESDGERLRLRAPRAGLFTRALEAGAALAPGQEAGTLIVLGQAHPLRVPPGAFGLVANERPERVHAPVGFRSVLYELRPLAGGGVEALIEETETGAGGLVLRASQTGRFYHRPSPDQPPFVSPGDVLDEGRAVGLIEVMKTFTHVPYRPAGGLPARARMVRWIVGEAADVSEGDALLEVEPA